MMAIGIAAAVVLGDVAASNESTPKTWVAVLDLIGGALLLGYAWHLHRHPFGPERQESMVEQMRKVASSPWIAVIGAGAALANAGAYIPIALKTISETDPSTTMYAVEWFFFTFVSLLPLLTAIILLLVAPRVGRWNPRPCPHVAPGPPDADRDRHHRPARDLAASQRHRRAHGLGRSLRYQRAALPAGQPSITPTVS